MATQFEIDCALMAGRAYQDTRNSTTWLPVPQGWSELEHLVKDSGFEAGYFKRSTGTNTEIVISFAGTGGDGDWGTNLSLYLGRVPAQLKEAADYYLSVKAANPNATITFTGHSLGGGLASLMAAFFGEQAATFDQAPFASTATVANAQIIKDYLLGLNKGYGTDPNVANALAKLDAFINGTDTLVNRTTGISNIFVQGEALQSFSGKLGTPQEIQQTSLLNNQPFGLTSTGLHSQALLTAFLQSESFRAATDKLPDLLPLIFDSKLYKTDVGTGKVNFIEKLVQSEAATPTGSLLDRFAADMTTLGNKQSWPSIVNDINQGNLGRALTAFAMQAYYENTAMPADKQIFTDVAGGVQFDRADIAATLDAVKGYTQYFKSYLNTLPASDRVIVEQLLPYMRDWYVQAGTSGMNATDTMNRGAFMLGGSGSDALVGGTASDLLVGNAGDDLLMGGQGNDFLLGGLGNDAYVYQSANTTTGYTGDGLDTLFDSDGNGSIVADGVTLAGGDQYGDGRVHRDANGHLYVDVGQGLAIDGNMLVLNYQSTTGNGMGLTMSGPVADINPATTRDIYGDLTPDGSGNTDDLGNLVTNGVAAPGRADGLNDSSGNDHIMSGGGDDLIYAFKGGDDIIEAGAGQDKVIDQGGNNVIIGGADGDILLGGADNDRLYADTQITVAAAIATGNIPNSGSGLKGDWLSGGAGDDTLTGGNAQDVLMGGAGADLLIGGAGDDDIAGDGGYEAQNFTWTVYDTPASRVFYASTGEWAPAGGAADVIYAGEGNDHAWGQFGNDVIFGEGGDDILSGGEDNDIVLGGAGSDKLYGDVGSDYLDGGNEADELHGSSGDDILIGGAGTDTLDGGTGRDTYIFNRGDGPDWIYDGLGENNTLRFGAGISSNDIALNLGSLKLNLGNGDEIHIANFDQNDAFNSSSINSFEFADGATLTTTELLARGFDIDGTAGADTLTGTNTTDRISGLGGDDTLIAGAGDDILAGGTGNDILQGGAGNDTYLFNLGDGQDRVADGANAVGNAVQFGTGITAGNTQFFQQGADLLVKYGTQGDTILIQNFVPNGLASAQAISQFQFADGSQGAYMADGQGNAGMKAYDANGRLAGEFWQAQGGGYGNDTYNTDGSSSGSSYSQDGSYSNYTNDGIGNMQMINYSNQGIRIGDSWSRADGSYGSDVFNSDGSSTGSTHLGDGSYSTYTNDGHGDVGTFSYNALGVKTGETWGFANGNYRTVTDDGLGNVASTIYDFQGSRLSGSWSKADGSFGSDNFNSDGSSFGVIHHADGTYNTYTNDGQGQVLTKNYSWNGSLTGSSITETNGLHNVITSYDNAAGVKLRETWIHSDGRSGSDLVSTLDYNGTLNLKAQVSSAYPSYGLGAYSYGSWTNPDGASGSFFGGDSWGNGSLRYENDFKFSPPSGSTWGVYGGDYVSLNSDGSPSYVGSETYLPNGSYIRYEARPISVITGGRYITGIAEIDFSNETTGVDVYGILETSGAKYLNASGYYGGTWHTSIQSAATAQTSMTATVQGKNGSYSIFRDDGHGNMELVSYDANDVKLDEMWLHNDGSHGVDTFNADGSITGQSINPDGTTVSYRDDGHGNIVTTTNRGVLATLQNVPFQIAPQPDIALPSPPASLTASPGHGYSLPSFYTTTSPDNQGGTYAYRWMPDGSVNVAHLDANGNLLSGGFVQTDPGFGANTTVDGNKTGWTYDVAGIPTSSYCEDGAGNLITYFYDELGRFASFSVAATDSQGGVTTTFHDATGHLTGSSTKLTTGQGQVTITTYDTAGQVTGSSVAVTDGQSNTVTSSYDAAGTLLSFSTMIVTSTGAVEITSYDALGVATGAITTITNSQGVISTSTFDAAGKYTGTITAKPNGAGGFSTSDYDATGALIFYVTLTSNAQHDTIVTTYDAYGIKIRDNTLKNGGVQVSNSYSYDGSIVSTTHDPDRSFCVSTNDGMGNVTTTHYSAQEVKLSDTWIRADGSNGTDTFNADGTVNSIASYADGTSSTSINNGHGEIATRHYGADGATLTGTSIATNVQGNLQAVSYDANGAKLNESWVKTDGSYGNIAFNANGSSFGTSYSPDGSYSNYIVGTAAADVLTGTAASDVIDGLSGADILIGGLGNDTYVVDNAGDVITESSVLATEIDAVQSSITYTLGGNVENLALTGTAAINGTGNALNNTIAGNAGNNILDGGAGYDEVSYSAAAAGVTVDLSLYTAQNTGGDGMDTLLNFENILGSSHNDTLTGNSLDNVMNGGAGADTLVGELGNDTYMVGNTGDKVIENSGEGTDTVNSTINYKLGANVEHLTLTGTNAIDGTGNELNNVIMGNSANNALDGGAGADNLIGGAGNDTYVVDNAGDVVTETSMLATEIDTVKSLISCALGSNVENLFLIGAAATNGTGNALNNVITGNAAGNTLDGGGGNDTLNGGAGADILTGGSGNDTYVVDNAGDVITESSVLATEIDAVQSSITYALGGNVENLALTGTAAINGAGNALNNTIAGNAGNNILDGGAGYDEVSYSAAAAGVTVDLSLSTAQNTVADGIDTLLNFENILGSSHNDTLTGNSLDNVMNGGAGADTLVGGLGNDIYMVDSIGDVVTETSSLATEVDTVNSWIASYSLGENLENLTLAGAAVNGTGNALDNILTGNSGANVLDGSAGADTLIGGQGNDTYIVDNLGDVVSETSILSTEIDTVISSTTHILSDNVENLVLTGTTTTNGTGNALKNIITGNAEANVLDGMAGADTLIGGLGNDTYVVDNIGDVVTETSMLAMEIDTVNSWITSCTLGDNLENLTLAGAAAINGTGNALGNEITGNASANVLYGQAGSDILYGMAGNDTLDGGSGADTLIGGEGNDTYMVDNISDVIAETSILSTEIDTVISSVTYTLCDNVENLTLAGASAIDGTGNALDNVIMGNSANNVLDGGVGYDWIYYNSANTGVKVDLSLTSAQNTVGAGIDTILNFERIQGSYYKDTLTGNSSDNILDGLNGGDTLTGGYGDDIYVVDNFYDAVIEKADEGIDTVRSSTNSYQLTGNVENLILTGTAYYGFGNALNNIVAGNAGDNYLDGGAGYDWVYYDTATAGVTVNLSLNSSQNTVSAGKDKLYNFEGLLGSRYNDKLTGNSLDNTLIGGVGADALAGGAGNDRYVFNTGDGTDIIVDALGNDILFIGGNLTEANLEGIRDGDNMVVNVLGTDDSITLTNWFVQGEGVNRIEFGNGSSLDRTGIEGLLNCLLAANPDAFTVYEDGGVTNMPVAALLANDTDPNTNDVISVISVGTSAVGASVALVNGQVQYDIGNRFQELSAGQTVTDSFVYTISDSKGVTASSIVNVTITGVNDAPVTADDDAAAVQEDTALIATGNVLTNDSDVDQSTVLSVANAGTLQGNYGSLILNADGGYTYMLDNASLAVQSLAAGQIVTESFSYQATDGIAFTPAMLTVSITGTNDAPVAVADVAVAQEDLTIIATGNVLANDTDVDQGAVLSVVDAGLFAGSYGQLTLATDGSYSYALNNASLGAQLLAAGQVVTETFAYAATDGLIATPSTLTVTITGTNDAPVTVADVAVVQEDISITATGNVLINDSDVDQGAALSVLNAGVFAGNYGQLTLAADGNYNYTLDNASPGVQLLAAGQVVTETFAYEATDGIVATPSALTVSITGTNDAPVAAADVAYVREDLNITATGNVLTNDSDVDQGTVLSVADAGIRAGSYGSLNLAADGSYSYALDNASMAVQSLGRTAQVVEHFGYTATDGMVGASSVLDVFLNGANDAPILVAPLADQNFTFNKHFSWQMPEGSFTDIDQGDTLGYAATLADGSALPDWLNFDAATRTFSGETPKEVGFIDVQVTATDSVAATGSTAGSLSASDVFRISVSHGNEGVGNGKDAPPPGHDRNTNDGGGTAPGRPGSKGGNGYPTAFAKHPQEQEPHDSSSDVKKHKDDTPQQDTGDSGSQRTDELIRTWFEEESTSERYSSFSSLDRHGDWGGQIDRQVKRNVAKGVSGDVSSEWERMNAQLKKHLEQSGGDDSHFAESGTGSRSFGLFGSGGQQGIPQLGTGNGQQLKALTGLKEGLERLGC